MTQQVDLSTPQAVRQSVVEFRDEATTNTRRGSIRHAWAEAGIPNQFAAMMRAADMEADQHVVYTNHDIWGDEQ